MQKKACLEYLKQTDLIYRLMNMASISAQVGNHESLELVLENDITVLNTSDGTTLLDIAQGQNNKSVM